MDASGSAKTKGEGCANHMPAKMSTKYDVVPPLSQPSGAVQPRPSSLSSTAIIPVAPTRPSMSSPCLTNSAELLKQAHARISAMKQASNSPAPTSSLHDKDVQVFEMSHLRTIKCDICHLKNTSVLYKCQTCALQHQICSRCVETTEPEPAPGTPARKDWSIHAKLKDAHADYQQPTCLGRQTDGSYIGDSIEFAAPKPPRGPSQHSTSNTARKKGITASDRNAAARRAIDRNRSTGQAQRIQAMAQARVKRGTSEIVKERVEQAEIRRAAEALMSLSAESIEIEKRQSAAEALILLSREPVVHEKREPDMDEKREEEIHTGAGAGAGTVDKGDVFDVDEHDEESQDSLPEGVSDYNDGDGDGDGDDDADDESKSKWDTGTD